MRYRAAWILPITSPPIRDGYVEIVDGSIVASGFPVRRSAEREGGSRTNTEIDLGNVALLPGLVNAHTHLELSHLHNAIPPADTFMTWIRGIMAERRKHPDPRSTTIVEAARKAIADAHSTGTVLFGDISNTLVTVDALVASPVAGVVFYELIRFNCPDPAAVITEALAAIGGLTATERVRVGLAAHAPYSVSPALFDAIRAAADRTPRVPYSVHLSESREEVAFIQSGQGPWRGVLESVGSWDESWRAHGGSPVDYLHARGFLGPRLLATHGVQMSAGDLRTLAAQGTTLVTCPRSNQLTGAGTPPLEDFYASGVSVAVGTDSLASCPDLNMFSELAGMHAIAPGVPARQLLESATLIGARALGFDEDYGSIEPGKRAPLLAVTLPPGVDDVEQYLIGGVASEQVQWIGNNER